MPYPQIFKKVQIQKERDYRVVSQKQYTTAKPTGQRISITLEKLRKLHWAVIAMFKTGVGNTERFKNYLLIPDDDDEIIKQPNVNLISIQPKFLRFYYQKVDLEFVVFSMEIQDRNGKWQKEDGCPDGSVKLNRKQN